MLLIRWYALAFLYRDLSTYWSGVRDSLIICGVLVAIVCGILFKYFSRFDRLLKRISSGGPAATPEETVQCLNSYRYVCIGIWITDIVGFFIGQVIIVILGIVQGRVPLFIPRITFVILQCLVCAVFTAMVECLVVNEMYARKRTLLNIHSLDGLEKARNMKFSTNAIILVLVSFVFIAINIMIVPFQLLANPLDMAPDAVLAIYLKDAVTSAIVSLGLCSVVSIVIFTSFASRITMNLERVNGIADDGNLKTRLNLNMLDDYGQLTGAINKLIIKLNSMITELKNGTDVVGEQSDTLSQVTGQATGALEQMKEAFTHIETDSAERNSQVTRAEKEVVALTEDVEHVKEQVITQTASIEQTSAAVTQMSANIAKVAGITRQADQVSSALNDSSRNGNEAIKGAVDAIRQIQEASLEMQDMVKVIQRIASQTNLLSMNAAIEASHAGEYGAGFAVVADEVRSLAESSSVSAKKIQAKIKDMVQKINSGVESITVAGNSFTEIEKHVEDTGSLVRTIAESMTEQQESTENTMRTTEQMVQAIQSVKELAEHESQRAEQVRSIMKSVSDSSTQALELVHNGVTAAQNLSEAIVQVHDSVDSNRAAVESMYKTVSSFQTS